jgi:membrane-bound inhibitor of C-type lysozyme
MIAVWSRRFVAASVIACACACVHAKTIHATFHCDGGKSIVAAFENGAQSSVDLTLSDGRHLALPHARSADGARYASADESFVFWNKGNTAIVEEKGHTTFSGCVTSE